MNNGCRAIFYCAGSPVSCGDWRNRNSTCACEAVLVKGKPRQHAHHPPPMALTLLIAVVANSAMRTQQRTLEFYLQEVAAQVLLSKLQPRARAVIQELDQLFESVLQLVIPDSFEM